MRLSTRREDLLSVIEAVAPVAVKSTFPIYECIRMDAAGGVLSARATNNEITLESSQQCDGIETEGVMVVNASRLLSIIKSLPPESSVKLEAEGADGNSARVVSGRSRFQLQEHLPDAVPSVPSQEDVVTLTLPGKSLTGLLHSIAGSMANRDVRYFLNGALIEVSDGAMTMVSTDGHRLSLDRTDVEASGDIKCIVPRESVLLIQKMAAKVKDLPVTIHVSSNLLSMELGEERITTKLLDGSFPDYRRVIPGSMPTKVTVSPADLSTGVQLASILANEKYNGLKMDVGGGQMVLSANNEHGEDASQPVSAEITGPDTSIGVNAVYLRDVAARAIGETITLELEDASKAMRVTDSGRPEYIGVIMPMRL